MGTETGPLMQSIIDDDDLCIRFVRGASAIAIVVFTGVGRRSGWGQVEEFHATLSLSSDRNGVSAIFVTDKRRVWYNNGLGAHIVPVVNDLVRAVGASVCVTLGNSMGGLAAIAFARHLRGCAKAIAFGPQSSVAPWIVPFESRWRDWRAAIESWDVADAAAALNDAVAYHLFFGAADALDAKHAARFQALDRRNVHITAVPGSAHNVAMHLKQERRLAPLLDHIIWGTPFAPVA